MALVLLAVLADRSASRARTQDGRTPEPRSLEAVLDRRGPRRHVDPLRRARRDRSPSAPGVINLGIEGSMLSGALAALRRRRADRQPVDRRRSPARSPAALLASVHAFIVLDRQREPARHRPRRAVPRPRPHRPVRRRLREPGRSSRFTPCDVPVLSRIPWHRADPLRPRPADLPVVPRGRRRVVVAVPQPLGPAAPHRRRAAPRCSRPTATRRCQVQLRSPSSPAARSPASAAPSCRPPTPTPGSRT